MVREKQKRLRLIIGEGRVYDTITMRRRLRRISRCPTRKEKTETREKEAQWESRREGKKQDRWKKIGLTCGHMSAQRKTMK